MCLCRPTHPQRVVRHIRLGLASRGGMPERPARAGRSNTRDVGDKKVSFPIPPRFAASMSTLRRRTVPFAQGVTWRCPTTWE
jgi:hypothetical protein